MKLSSLGQCHKFLSEVGKIPGGYVYNGAASLQVCFPLRAGGELRFGISDEDDDDDILNIDLYGGELPPCITGSSHPTGEKSESSL